MGIYFINQFSLAFTYELYLFLYLEILGDIFLFFHPFLSYMPPPLVDICVPIIHL